MEKIDYETELKRLYELAIEQEKVELAVIIWLLWSNDKMRNYELEQKDIT